MTSWIEKVFSSGVDKVVDSVAVGLDNLFTSDEEKLILKNKEREIKLLVNSQINKFKIQVEQEKAKHDKEVSSRWISDNANLITRLVRPLGFVFMLFLFAVIVLSDGNLGTLTINELYIPVIATLLSTMTIAYYGSRGFEKVHKVHTEGKNNARIAELEKRVAELEKELEEANIGN